MPAERLQHKDYMDAVEYAAEWMTPITADFLTREERGRWFRTFTAMRFAATQKDIRIVRELTDIAMKRASVYYSNGLEVNPLSWFQMYDMRVLASMTGDQIRVFNSHLVSGQTDLAYYVYDTAAQVLSEAEQVAKRTV